MIKKEITFEDFDGNIVTQAHYFHLSKSELIEMELTFDGGMQAMLETMTKNVTGNGKKIIEIFKDVIGRSYGVRVDGDSSKFVKSNVLTSEFLGSLAFDAMFTEIMSVPTKAAEFIRGVVPRDLAEQPDVIKALEDAGVPAESLTQDGLIKKKLLAFVETGLKHPNDEDGNVLPWAFREPTPKELSGMTHEQMLDAFSRKSSDWKPQ